MTLTLCMKGLFHEKIVRGGEGYRFFSPQGFTKKKKHTHKNIWLYLPPLMQPRGFKVQSHAPIPKMPLYPNYRKKPKVGRKIIHVFCGAPQKIWVNLVWMTTGIIFTIQKSKLFSYI